MRKKLMPLSLFMINACAFAQENANGIDISGSADAYWKYDFANQENISTYFANDHNSISLGMLALAVKKSTGKASFVGEVSFGPRGQYLTIPNGDGTDDNKLFVINFFSLVSSSSIFSSFIDF
ncbi:putative OmpL-like beta-barrel porin-2 [Sphingobacterium alimentarium]|uniref:Putative OmpL-like beta-barrel porin-2 n=1 Tax=Sphingobacterium alimentarium TaxID=797292 RepID=A0A4R3VTN0_9SPHI|nr:outer membrane beta-barrel protein [Sphingobacterium alimentarium]TCV09619.1 putative OmpL-like beta-barrel porin-2 [Sphingobacterium alimentarium]